MKNCWHDLSWSIFIVVCWFLIYWGASTKRALTSFDYDVLRCLLYSCKSTLVMASFIVCSTSTCSACNRWSLYIWALCTSHIAFQRNPITMFPPIASQIAVDKKAYSWRSKYLLAIRFLLSFPPGVGIRISHILPLSSMSSILHWNRETCLWILIWSFCSIFLHPVEAECLGNRSVSHLGDVGFVKFF